MSLSDEQYLFQKDLTHLYMWLMIQKSITKVTQGEAQRSQQIQNLYYYGYRITFGKNKLPMIYKCKPKSKKRISNHSKKLAQDLFFWINGKLTWKKSTLQFIGDYWESLSEKNRWGGNYKSWKDTPHFERRP